MTKKELKNNLVLNIGRTAKLMDEGRSCMEIAAILNKPESTVRSWMATVEKARATS